MRVPINRLIDNVWKSDTNLFGKQNFKKENSGKTFGGPPIFHVQAPPHKLRVHGNVPKRRIVEGRRRSGREISKIHKPWPTGGRGRDCCDAISVKNSFWDTRDFRTRARLIIFSMSLTQPRAVLHYVSSVSWLG